MMKVCVFWSDVVEICYDTQSSMFCFFSMFSFALRHLLCLVVRNVLNLSFCETIFLR
jgi:hypothetical protein